MTLSQQQKEQELKKTILTLEENQNKLQKSLDDQVHNSTIETVHF